MVKNESKLRLDFDSMTVYNRRYLEGKAMKKKLTSRTRQAEATRKKIYNTAIRLFKQYGYEQVSVSQIAKAANVGIGTFYHYYESKIELFMKIFVNVDDYFDEFKNLDCHTQDPAEIIQRYFYQYAKLNECAGIEIVQNLANPQNRKSLDGNQDFEQILTSIIKNYQELGKIKTNDSANEICDLFFICARGVMFDWCIKHGQYDLAEKTQKVIERLLLVYLV